MKDFADDNFKFDENGRKLSKQVENTVGKGEITRYEQFLLFPQCFQKACFPGVSKGVIVWEWVKFSYSCQVKRENEFMLSEYLPAFSSNLATVPPPTKAKMLVLNNISDEATLPTISVPINNKQDKELIYLYF